MSATAKMTPPLAVPSSLVRVMPVRPTASLNSLAWLNGRSGRCLRPGQHDLVGRRIVQLLHHPHHLLELFHQVALVLQAAGGIGDQHIRPAGAGSLDGVADDGAESAPVCWAITGMLLR